MDGQSIKRFLRTIDILKDLNHPNIVRYLDNGKHKSTYYFVTEYFEGTNASKFAKLSGGKLHYKVVGAIIDQLLSALEYLLSKGIVHRDVKEQNILVNTSSQKYSVKLADFGLAKNFKVQSDLTMIGDVAATIAYMPPEQIRDFKDTLPISDIYAVGMTAYTLLTGNHALDISPRAGIAETVKAIFEKPIIPISQRIPDVPPRFASVIETAIAKQVELRWRTAGEMRDALLRAMS